MVGFAYQRRGARESVAGLIVTTNEQSIGSTIADILLLAEYMPEEEIKDQVVVFPALRRIESRSGAAGSPKPSPGLDLALF